MNNTLLEYLNNRMGEKKNSSRKEKQSGPLITISREVGCNGVILAEKIVESLNKRQLEVKWRVLSKEVFYQSAKELDMDPEQVKRIFKFDSYTFNDILNAFGTRKFKSEKKIINTVIDVIHSFAEEGNCVIVGRAAHIIAHDIKNALHIRLVAPFEYRIKNIMVKNCLNREEAIEFIHKVERERTFFRKAIRKETLEDACFDMCINRASFAEDKTIELIELAADKKNIFSGYTYSPRVF